MGGVGGGQERFPGFLRLTVFSRACPTLHTFQECTRATCSASALTHVIVKLLKFSHSSGCALLSRYDLNLLFLDDW